MTVTGSFAADFVTAFIGADGKRKQPVIEIVENTLKFGATDVIVTVTETQIGRGKSGITAVNENCTELKVNVNEQDLAIMKVGDDIDMDLTIRIGEKDLNIPPIIGKLCVKDSIIV